MMMALSGLGRATITRRWSRQFSQQRPLGKHSRKERQQARMAGWWVGGLAVAAGTGSAVLMANMEPEFEPLRAQDFHLTAHSHGKTRVRVLKVDRSAHPRHEIGEYTVSIVLHSSSTEACFLTGDNAGIVATDTQKNICYVVAKKFDFSTPEDYALLLAQFLLLEYHWLDAVDVEVEQTVWERVSIEGEEHPHGFTKSTPEVASAIVHLERGHGPVLTSSVSKLTVLKTTQSGFEGYVENDPYTLLPPCQERCLATEIDAVWTYQLPRSINDPPLDFAHTRRVLREQLCRGFFGKPSTKGVYSPSLQATVYDAACLVLGDCPEVHAISIRTPNLHYLPTTHLLERLGERFDNDVFVPTSEPSGVITCTVSRGLSGEQEIASQRVRAQRQAEREAQTKQREVRLQEHITNRKVSPEK